MTYQMMATVNHDGPKDLSSSKLFLRLHDGGYSYIVVRSKDNFVEFYHEEDFRNSSLTYIDALKEAIYGDEILLADFGRVYVSIHNNRYTLVPSVLCPTSELMRSAYSFCFHNHEDEVLCDTVAGKEISLIYGMQKPLYDFILRTFAVPVFTHALSSVCNYFYNKSYKNSKLRMYAFIHEHVVDIVCVDRRSILLVNSFKYRQESDIAYHILNVWQQLEMDVLSDELRVVAPINRRRGTIALCKEYIRCIIPFIYPSGFDSFGVETEQLPFDLLLSPLSETICES